MKLKLSQTIIKKKQVYRFFSRKQSSNTYFVNHWSYDVKIEDSTETSDLISAPTGESHPGQASSLCTSGVVSPVCIRPQCDVAFSPARISPISIPCQPLQRMVGGAWKSLVTHTRPWYEELPGIANFCDLCCKFNSITIEKKIGMLEIFLIKFPITRMNMYNFKKMWEYKNNETSIKSECIFFHFRNAILHRDYYMIIS